LVELTSTAEFNTDWEFPRKLARLLWLMQMLEVHNTLYFKQKEIILLRTDIFKTLPVRIFCAWEVMRVLADTKLNAIEPAKQLIFLLVP
jgi:hypothetical protein